MARGTAANAGLVDGLPARRNLFFPLNMGIAWGCTLSGEKGGQDFAGRSGSLGSKARVPVNRRQPMLALVV